MRKILLFLAGFSFAVSAFADAPPHASAPSVLVLHDGPEKETNPGYLDALYLANLLGHFTTLRQVHPLEDYVPGEWKKYDAVFVIVYQRKYQVPSRFINDIAQSPKTFCWLGNQVGQLDRQGILRDHGISFVRFEATKKYDHVFYKSHALPKGDIEINQLVVRDDEKVKVLATAGGAGVESIPYVLQSGSFWVVADSPFSYSAENDRYLAFCDVLHDILGIDHTENHSAILRIEDINAMSETDDLEATLEVIRRHHIPFTFGFVPMYVNPQERTEFRLADKPDVVSALKDYVNAGGVPVLHGFTHQYRGVTTDDYEFWDDLSDRPVRGDSEAFVTRRLKEAIREATSLGLYPVTWETPHYAASDLDYRVIHRFFETVFERRIAANTLNADQLFPYPVIDLYGQYVIPESLGYIPIDDQRTAPVLEAADAMEVVRDGYASFFFHPFLKPALLEDLIAGVEKRGYHFVDIRSFPNEVRSDGRLIKTAAGSVEITGEGHYLNEYVLDARGREKSRHSLDVEPRALVKRNVRLSENQTYVALRQEFPAPGILKRLVQLAKGDISVLQRKLGTVLAAQTVRNPVKTIILWNSKASGEGAMDQRSFLSAFTSLGFDVEKTDYARLLDEELGPFTMLVIPQTTAKLLPQPVVERIVTALNGGIVLITDGESPLSEELGIRLGPPSPVSVLQDHLFVNQDTRWPDKPSVPWIAEPSREEANVYYSDRDTQRPLVISRKQRQGRYLYFAPLFDSLTGEGYARFPNLPQILFDELQVRPMAQRMGAEVFFDPGYRQSISIEVLARMWRRYGIRAVHAAAWHFYDKYSYDYARLVKVAHQNGILVYAWFEWPEVSERFWDRYPQWREKNSRLKDAHVDWRFLMNLQDPQCLKAVLKDMETFLRQYDWDGVNVGELTFESLEGPQNQDTFTPFNAQARHDFESLYHFDPLDLFNPQSEHAWPAHEEGMQQFYAYRRDVNSKLLKTFLDSLEHLNVKHHLHWDIVVTMLDALQHPELSDYLGIDVDRTVALVNQHNATLQAEDPSQDWSKPPNRYLELGERYKRLPLRKPFMIDINVLSVHPSNQKGFATAQPTGVEVVQLWRAASSQTSRVCLYAESTVHEQDWEIMPYAMAANTDLRREGDNWVINTPQTIRLDVGATSRKFRLDNQPWYCNDKGSVWIPKGNHTLSFSRLQKPWFDTTDLETHLLSISGELLGNQKVSLGLEILYESPNRCAMMFNKNPLITYIDGKLTILPSVKGDMGFTVLAPPGRHRLRVVSLTVGKFIVEFISLVTASLIVLFGVISSGLLAILFVFIMVNRRMHRIRRYLRNYFS